MNPINVVVIDQGARRKKQPRAAARRAQQAAAAKAAEAEAAAAASGGGGGGGGGGQGGGDTELVVKLASPRGDKRAAAAGGGDGADASRAKGGGGGGGDGDDDGASEAPTNMRDRATRFLDEPRSSNAAFAYTICVLVAIIASVLNFLIESTPDFTVLEPTHPSRVAIFFVECVIVALFTFDYFAKLVLTRRPRWRWALEFLNVIDFVSILPFFIELVIKLAFPGGANSGVDSLVVLRVLRLFRVFRIFKVAKYFVLLQIVGQALRRSVAGFVLLGFMIAIALILFSAMEFYAEQSVAEFHKADRVWYYTEREADGSLVASHFQSVPDAMWWCLVTITTVGYGDRYPRSALGKVVGSITIISGLLVLAFPLTIVGSNFADVWAEHRAAALEEEKEDIALKADTMNRPELIAALKNEVLQLRTRIDELKSAVAEQDDRWYRMQAFVDALATHQRTRRREMSRVPIPLD